MKNPEKDVKAREDTNYSFAISEIFLSIQGESSHVGRLCVFVRFQGCSLRCIYCDTTEAQDFINPNAIMTFDEILEKISSYDCKFIELTGGEPLEREGIDDLIDKLIDLGYEVAIETNGSMPIKNINPLAKLIIDIKTPGSLMADKNDYDNLLNARKNSEIKFALTSFDDYQWAKHIVHEYNLFDKFQCVLLSPVSPMTPKYLAELIIQDQMNFRLNMQIHKVIWGVDAKGV